MTEPQNPRVMRPKDDSFCDCPLHKLFPQRIADLVEPTFCDLQSACDMIGKDNYGKPVWTPKTIHPHNPVVQAFARHREAAEAASKAREAKLREALHDAICMIGHAMPMDTTALAGRRLVAREVWQTGYDLLHPKPKKETADENRDQHGRANPCARP